MNKCARSDYEEINYEQSSGLHLCGRPTDPGQLERVKNKTDAITTLKNYASHFLKTFINAQYLCQYCSITFHTKTEVDLL